MDNLILLNKDKFTVSKETLYTFVISWKNVFYRNVAKQYVARNDFKFAIKWLFSFKKPRCLTMRTFFGTFVFTENFLSQNDRAKTVLPIHAIDST